MKEGSKAEPDSIPNANATSHVGDNGDVEDLTVNAGISPTSAGTQKTSTCHSYKMQCPKGNLFVHHCPLFS